ncbi:hypothetical protein SERLA73DRAFT_174466 [Serpula lacrymans var. lacrymans S7.3]|uniref:Uncharacterized protein n=2 Tax=Serpula lacrymans var. lacrymans TaxID=341189 RepID=F8PG17_SERL3|nr:uncharacterized protein SERLADRAFT_455997 [Serpula lacrymans var. lacrymans S7.9]EGO05352.1 hypothetical protein SERLA73DRAFT_174466 [Serpula lacrymans var. lacrymans S7.3]EGO31203.1 hypothetical protein SERLADRAFT_455997 [Serpula lacrymans var. lacrymans S7.9]
MGSPSQASNHVYSAFALLATALIIIPLPLHLRVQRTSTCLFIVWFALTMLNSSINSIIWSNNTVNWAPGWCYISSYVLVASKYGVQLAPLCIARRAYRIASQKFVKQSQYDIRRDLIVELFIGIGIPVLLLPLYYVVQGNCFMIIEQVGCYPMIVRTSLAFPLVVMWPPIFALISAVYFAFSAYSLIRQKSLRKQLFGSDGHVESDSYWRLIALAGAQIILILPSGIFALVNDISGGPMAPYSWDFIHYEFSVPQYVSISDWTFNLQNALAFQWDRWTTIIYALLFFAFFGFRADVLQYYRGIFLAILRPFGYRPSTPDLNDLEASNEPPARKRAPNPWSIGSLRFFHTSDIGISANQAASLPPIPSSTSCLPTSSDEQSHSCTTNSGGGEDAKRTDSSSRSFKSPYCMDDSVVSLGLIAEPEPVIEASSVLRRHSLDLEPA